METIIQDIRHGARSLLKRPGFTVIALITLALGIGANTAIFSVVNAVLLRPLPFKNPDRVMMVWERRPNSHAANLPVSGHEYAAWKERSQSFDALALVQPDGVNLTGRGDPVTVSAARVSADFFSVIGIAPVLGRAFLPGEDQGGTQTVVLGQKLWNQRFGSDQRIVGQTVTLNNQTYNVVGVMPALELMPDVLLPINLPDEVRKVGKHSHQVMGRLKPGVTLAQAQTELAYISNQVEHERPETNTGHGVQVVTLHEESVGNVRTALLVLFGAVAFVLLIACANVATLLLTRAAARQKEMAICSALGAGRWRLVRQMLVESLLLAGTGGAMGLLAAVWLIEFIPRFKALGIPRLDQVDIDYRVLASTIGFSLFAGLFAGIAPALRHSGPRLSRWMNEGGRRSGSPDRRRLGQALIVVEVGLAMVLLIGGGLMLKSFVKLVKVDPGFDPHQVL